MNNIINFPEQLNEEAVLRMLEEHPSMSWLSKQLVNIDYVESKSPVELPSCFSMSTDVCLHLKLDTDNEEEFTLPCKVVGIHFSASKVLYDVAVKLDGCELYSILNNVDGTLLSTV